MTLAERELARDAIIRKACADEQLAIVFANSGLASFDVQRLLDDLAKASGYRELAVVPLFFVGHSAGGPQAKALAATFADRCFGLMQYRGGAPSWDPPVPPGIPSLMMLGQFDEFGKAMMRDENGRENWENGRDEMIKYRGIDSNNLGNIVIEPGAGHYAWSDRNAAYLALYLRKAAKARIGAITGDETAPIQCKPIDVASGWLTDLTIKATEHAPAPYGEYAGDKARAGWLFDRELADATMAYHQGMTKKDQFIRWTDLGVDENAQRFFFESLKWVGDGQTFEFHPVYAERYRKTPKTGTGPRWATPGEPVGHSQAPILVRTVGGPYVAVGPNRYRMKFDALSPAINSGRGTFLAYSEGDADYRYTEVVGMTPRNFAGITSGKEQTIAFPPVGDLRVDGGPIALKATSDSGLPVEYYVVSGPAVIEKGSLKLAEVPHRAAFPLEVRVVAYQFGRGVEPTIKTATPVEQVVRVVRP
ncbi:hypothetical protein [Lignipirellula cremea]|nr:hypothetical protein [Lignipirellula cremea]